MKHTALVKIAVFMLVASPALVNFRRSESDITVFKSVGFAALDLIAAEHVLYCQ